MPTAESTKLQKLVPLLLKWFSKHARDLPWRRTRDPYAIWVSEIMLQQTQVKTVIPYWERWMRELPTIEAVAQASPDRLHKLWEGLGYYTRVRNLQRAAQQIVNDHGGEFPENFNAILSLPGIGRYTAGAIASIAFNQPRPILDGNVIRVLTRIFGFTTDPREKTTNARLWQLAEQLVTQAKTLASNNCATWTAAGSEAPRRFDHLRCLPKAVSPLRSTTAVQEAQSRRPSTSCSSLNQSLMELGALVCTPRNPQCKICPAKRLCLAFRENRVAELPNLAKRAATTPRRFIAFVVERSGKFLVRRRPTGVVNAHLWEFPNVEIGARLSGRQLARTAGREMKLKLTSAKPLCTLKHSITRYRITLEAWLAKPANSPNGTPVSDPARSKSRLANAPGRRPAFHGQWLTLRQLHKLAFTAAHKKLLAQLGTPVP